VRFDKVYGVISSWTYEDTPLILSGPRLNFWRAPTDNDKGFIWAEDYSALEDWKSKGIHRLQHRLDSFRWEQLHHGKVVQVSISTRIAPPVTSWGVSCTYEYTIYGSGDIIIAVSGIPSDGGPKTLPRIGIQLSIPQCFDQVEWYGRGPGESYADSKQANRHGVYRKSVDELYTKYTFPQENGNRTDVKWVRATDNQGVGLIATGMPELNFSIHRFTTEQFERAAHLFDLHDSGKLIWNLDYRQHGLGSASCGPGVLPEYQLHTEAFQFGLRLSPYTVHRNVPIRTTKS
jgi:hypothetical protein